MADVTKCETESVYLDYNATTPLAPSVLNIIHETLRDAWGNPSSSHAAGKKAKEIIKEARKRVADMVGGNEDEIVFMSGGTEANNTVFLSAVNYYKSFLASCDDNQKVSLKRMPHFITSNIEHDSVTLAIDHLVDGKDCEKTVVNASRSSGMADVGSVIEAIKPNTCLVSIMMANNESGVIQPIREIVEKIKEIEQERQKKGYPKIFIHTDAAQTIGKIEVNVSKLGVDYLTIVGHKFYGPRIGALYVRSPTKDTPLFPMLFGGGQEQGFRPGTENTGMIAGLGEAAHLVSENLEKYSEHMKKVRDYLEQKLLEQFPSKVKFNGKFKTSQRIPNTCNVSFLGDGFHGYRILTHLKRTQASLGAACHADLQFSPSRILLALGVPPEVASNALRISVGRETSIEDIDIVVEDLKQSIAILTQRNDS